MFWCLDCRKIVGFMISILLLKLQDGTYIHVLYPDFIMFRDSFSTEAQLTFSDTFIRITGSTTCENQGAFDFEWGIDNLINIEC